MNARKAKLGAEAAVAEVRKCRELYTSKGRKLIHIEDVSAVSDDELEELILGRSGTLKAPTVRTDDQVVIVGFNEAAYRAVFSE